MCPHEWALAGSTQPQPLNYHPAPPEARPPRTCPPDTNRDPAAPVHPIPWCPWAIPPTALVTCPQSPPPPLVPLLHPPALLLVLAALIPPPRHADVSLVLCPSSAPDPPPVPPAPPLPSACAAVGVLWALLPLYACASAPSPCAPIPTKTRQDSHSAVHPQRHTTHTCRHSQDR